MAKFDKTEPVSADSKPSALHVPTTLPKVTITYCTQCRWLLRAAYFAQELLSTFDTALGEVALRPTTGGVLTVVLDYSADASTTASASSPAQVATSGQGAAEPADADAEAEAQAGAEARVLRVLLWDRKAEGGFPETKVLKQRVRDVVQPGRGLGHSDGHQKEQQKKEPAQAVGAGAGADGDVGPAARQSLGKDECETCP